jgi:RNA polymerase sigma-70 factor (ECF subfamily)
MADGELARFAALYPGLRRFAAIVGPYEVDPDDLVQEALVRTLERGGFDNIDDPAAYLRTVIVRLASNERRSLGRRRRAVRRLAASSPSETPASDDLSALLALSPEDRALLYLTIIEGRSYRDASSILVASEEALRARASRALRRLREHESEELHG